MLLIIISCKREQHSTKYRVALTTEAKTHSYIAHLSCHLSLDIVDCSSTFPPNHQLRLPRHSCKYQPHPCPLCSSHYNKPTIVKRNLGKQDRVPCSSVIFRLYTVTLNTMHIRINFPLQ